MKDFTMPFGFPLEGLPLAGNIAMLTDPPKYPGNAAAQIEKQLVATITASDKSVTAAKLVGLPVAGYQAQSDENVALVNENKILEERVLRQIDKHVRNRDSQDIDQRMVALARTGIQDAFMWLNRAVFQPKRVSLPEDAQ
jgi:hypothetical protein